MDLSLTSLILSCFSLWISLVVAILYLSHKFSTHKVEYVTQQQQQAIRKGVGLSSDPDRDAKLKEQINDLFNLGDFDGPVNPNHLFGQEDRQ